MTRKELKEHCRKQIELCEVWAKAKGKEPNGRIYEEHKLILELLEQEPCEDAISRQVVIDAMYALCDTGGTLKENPWRDNPHIDAIIDVIDDLPPVTPQPKIGKWKAFTYSAYHGNDEDGEPIWREVTVYHCNLCNRRTVIKENYCPNCGAKMEG